MDVRQVVRFGAACGVIVGLATGIPGAVEAFSGETTATSLVLGFGAAFAVPFLVAVALVGGLPSGRFGAVSYGVGVVGIGLFGGVAFALNVVLAFLDESVVEDLRAGPTGPALRIAGAVFVVGALLVAVGMLRAGRVPRLAAVGYGVLLPALALTAPLPDSVATSALHVLAGAVLVWLGVTVWRSADVVPAVPSVASGARVVAR